MKPFTKSWVVLAATPPSLTPFITAKAIVKKVMPIFWKFHPLRFKAKDDVQQLLRRMFHLGLVERFGPPNMPWYRRTEKGDDVIHGSTFGDKT